MDNSPIITVCVSQYNEDINPLLTRLCNEIDSYQLPIDIVARDDHSRTPIVVDISTPYLDYTVNAENLGRAGNRNLMGSTAQGAFLLFIDGDVFPATSDFLQNYLKLAMDNTHKVASGGIKYQEKVPSSEYLLHYRYGTERESVDTPHSALKTSNLFIQRQLFLSNLFDESLKDYGHEDTLMSSTLKDKNISVASINNPIIHKGLHTNEEFIQKQEEALRSLRDLHNRGHTEITKLQHTYNKIRKTYMMQLLSKPFVQKWLKKRLLKKPNADLRLLDLYKIGKFHCLLSEK